MAGVDTVSTAIALHCIMDGVHVTVTIVAVHVLGPSILGTWGRSELYPPLFGRLRDLGSVNLKAFWGRLWHDMLKGGLVCLTEKAVSLAPRRCAHEGAMQSALCFVISAVVHAAATYSVSQSVSAAFQVFVGFSAQILGIMLQQGARSALSLSDSHGQRRTVQAASKIIEVTIGIGWIWLSFPSIYKDPALRAVTNSVDQLVLA
ncbi:hypothetical protein ED733_000153 [Metarhizium rileyi]|uniref:Wax synthase domain-containing protein n=1 Tax=Metarhizium rileyi (strain RCEF 4871) TaxID=1649241 RepID=A0A5C6FY41_METRR|nr:hypothetical protein ED733_000153 [Metarhizium rileyi]